MAFSRQQLLMADKLALLRRLSAMHLVGELSEALQIGNTGVMALEEAGIAHRKSSAWRSGATLASCGLLGRAPTNRRAQWQMERLSIR